jgi:hypothetical protein
MTMTLSSPCSALPACGVYTAQYDRLTLSRLSAGGGHEHILSPRRTSSDTLMRNAVKGGVGLWRRRNLGLGAAYRSFAPCPIRLVAVSPSGRCQARPVHDGGALRRRRRVAPSRQGCVPSGGRDSLLGA